MTDNKTLDALLGQLHEAIGDYSKWDKRLGYALSFHLRELRAKTQEWERLALALKQIFVGADNVNPDDGLTYREIQSIASAALKGDSSE